MSDHKRERIILTSYDIHSCSQIKLAKLQMVNMLTIKHEKLQMALPPVNVMQGAMGQVHHAACLFAI